MKNLLKNACIYSAVNCKETFIYEYSNGKRCFADLKTVNHIVNNCKENIKILYSINSKITISKIFDMYHGVYYAYDIRNNEFFTV